MKKLLTNRIIIAAMALLAGLLIVFYSETQSRNVSGSQSLTDIKNIDTLRTQFNLDAGKTRLVILLSPTWVECLNGASWVQNQLNQYPSDQLRVYAIWIPMLGGDSRDDWDARSMLDPRVVHFWDGDLKAGQWFASEVDGYRGIAWDVYYLYSPDATWENVPSQLAGSGGTIYHEREKLKKELLALVGE